MRLTCALLLLAAVAEAQTIPRAALQYQRALIGNARLVWGLDAPIAVMAAQVHQESSWRANAQSKYASGLAQFTPGTADWISQRYPDLGVNQPFEPAWALRALARYDKFLYDRQASAVNECDRWAFVLSSYNGGEGNVNRDKRLCGGMSCCDPSRWWGHVELYSPRADWAFRENRGYPRVILLQRQPPYRAWGPGVDCS